MTKNGLLCISVLIFLQIISPITAGEKDFTLLKGPYLGQEPPGLTPKVFAPGVISTGAEEFGCAFSPDGTQFYFTRNQFDTTKQRKIMTIWYSEMRAGQWSEPEIAPFCRGYEEGEPSFAPSGDFILYGRMRKLEDGSDDPRVTIVRRDQKGWGESQDLSHGMFASITNDSIIYYTDISKGYSKGDIYQVRFTQPHLPEPKWVSGKVNSAQQDAHPFVTPEGDILVFDSNRPGGYGDNDLYICFRASDGSWSDPMNMGTSVNTEKYEALPYLTPDGNYLFFYRDNNIYWVDSRFLEQLASHDSN